MLYCWGLHALQQKKFFFLNCKSRFILLHVGELLTAGFFVSRSRAVSQSYDWVSNSTPRVRSIGLMYSCISALFAQLFRGVFVACCIRYSLCCYDYFRLFPA